MSNQQIMVQSQDNIEQCKYNKLIVKKIWNVFYEKTEEDHKQFNHGRKNIMLKL